MIDAAGPKRRTAQAHLLSVTMAADDSAATRRAERQASESRLTFSEQSKAHLVIARQ
jgi:hypothetical protein